MTVNYTADNDGYHVDRFVQEGFIDVGYRPPVTTKRPVPRPTPRPSIRPTTVRPLPVTTQKPKSDFDLIGDIIKQLTPHIKDSVHSSLGSSPGAASKYSSKPVMPKITPVVAYKSPTLAPYRPVTRAKSAPKPAPKLIPIELKPIRTVSKPKDETFDLVGRIIGQLTPHIKQSVSYSLGGDVSDPRLRTIIQEPKTQNDQLYDMQPINPESTFKANSDDLIKLVKSNPSQGYQPRRRVDKDKDNKVSSEKALIQKMIVNLTPQIKDSVSSIFNVAEDINRPDLVGFVKGSKTRSGSTTSSKPLISLSRTDSTDKMPYYNTILSGKQSSDDNLADKILSKLTPSIQTNVKSILDKNAFSYSNDKSDETIADDILAKLAPSIESNVKNILVASNSGLGSITPKSKEVSKINRVSGSSPIYPIGTYNPVEGISYNNPNTDERLADEILSKLTPSIQTNVQSILGKNTPSYINQQSDDKLAEDILASLTPSIENNVKSILSQDNGIIPGIKSNNPKAYKSDTSTNPLQAYLIGINDPSKDNEQIIDTVIKQLSPQIENSVASIFNFAEDDNQSKRIAPIRSFSYADKNADEKLADEILAKLAPSVTSSVKGLLGQKQTKNSGDSLFSGLDRTGGQIAKVSSEYPSLTYSSTDGSSTKGTDEIVNSIIKNLSPQIKGSVDNIFNVAEDINHPNFGVSVKDHVRHRAMSKERKNPLTSVSGFGKSSDEQLADEILGNLTPFIQGSVGTYFSNQDQNDGYTSSDNKDFTDGLIGELLPTIKTMVGSKFGGYGNNKKKPFFNF